MTTLTQTPSGQMTVTQARRWSEGIFVRRAVRTYDGTPLEPAQSAALAQLEPEPLAGARVRHVLLEGAEPAANIMKGLVGGYGRIIGVPALLVFVARQEDEGWPTALGYMGQQVILEATAHGLATCWVAGSFRRDAVAKYVPLAEGEVVRCVSPVGTAATTAGLRKLHDASLKWFAPGRGKRKPLEAIVSGTIADRWLEGALEAARWAPSAVNRQPWRFTVSDDGTVSITVAATVDVQGCELDCGIAMANFAVAARAQGQPGRWELGGGKEQPLAVWRRG